MPASPDYFLDLLASKATTPATRAVLNERLQARPNPTPLYFAPEDYATLRAVCAHLTEKATGDIIASNIDARLAKGETNGWRYDELPDDGTAIKTFLWALRARGFDEAGEDDRLGLLVDARDGSLTTLPDGWPAKRFFSDFLGEVVENYAAQPQTQADLNYAGFADRPGWSKIGLNERHNREPEMRPLLQAGEGEKTNSFSLELEPFPNRETEWQTIAPDSPGAMRRFSEDEEVDAVVVGTGAGGGPLLARLAAKGLKVVALEAGKWHDPRGFATDERAQNFLFWLDERLSAGKNAVPFGANNSGIGVGGSTIHYTAYTPRALPEDFQLRTDFGVGNDWPISYEELVPYYDEVEAFIGVSGPSLYPWGPPRKPYPLPPLPLNAGAQLMKRGCDALGIKTSAAPNAALSAPYFQEGMGWRAACSNRGFCQAGCSTGGKSSVDVTWIPFAVSKGAEIRPESFVRQIETAGGKVVAVVYTDADGNQHRQKTKALFLCAGAIETPRLLLLNGLANGSGQVGRNFMAHPGMQVWAQFEDETRPYKGIPGGLISHDTHRPQNADFVGGYLLQSLGVMPVTYSSQYARSQMTMGRELRDHLAGYNCTAGINILGDCLPYDHNFLELSDELDGRGLPKPRLHFTEGENESKMAAHAEQLMRQIFAEAGAKEMWSYNRHAHVIGTAMMGDDPASSVVDKFGRSHEIANLWVCDNSTFPSALDVNPALTIMALSLRTADEFARG
jgi:choline dehydrogenase-like flavoprotein